MSQTKHTLFQCDCDIQKCWPPAESQLDFIDGVTSWRAAKKKWRDEGWVTKKGIDYCPKCAKSEGVLK